jgi:hypothetical protein
MRSRPSGGVTDLHELWKTLGPVETLRKEDTPGRNELPAGSGKNTRGVAGRDARLRRRFGGAVDVRLMVNPFIRSFDPLLLAGLDCKASRQL